MNSDNSAPQHILFTEPGQAESSEPTDQSPNTASSQTQNIDQQQESDSNNDRGTESSHSEPQVRGGHRMITRAKSGIFKPKAYIVTTMSTTSEELVTFNQAIKDKN